MYKLTVLFFLLSCNSQANVETRLPEVSKSEQPQKIEKIKVAKENSCTVDTCVQVGLVFENGVESDLSKAAIAYQRGCELGNAHACGSIGVMHFYGHGVIADVEKGMRQLKSACQENYGEACANLGIIFNQGRYGEVDDHRAQDLFKKGCRLKSITACEALEKK